MKLDGSVSDLSKGTENQVDTGSNDGVKKETVETETTIPVAETEAAITVTDENTQAEGDQLHLKFGRSHSTPVTQSNGAPQVKKTLPSSLQSPKEHPMRKTTSMEDISEANELYITELVGEVFSLKKEVNSYKEVNNKLNQSLDYANSLLREEKKWNLRLLSERSLTPLSSPTVSERRPLAEEFTTVPEEASSLATISETGTAGANKGATEPRRLSFERRRSEEFKNFERQTSDEYRSRRPTMERRNSIAEEEIVQRRRVYGQRKASMSLDEMFDLFGVHSNNNLQSLPLPQSPSSTSANVSKESSPTLSRPQSTAKTLSFEVSKDGVPLHTQKDF